MNRFDEYGEVISRIRKNIKELELQKAELQLQIDVLNKLIEKNVYLLHGYSNATSENGK